jgi:NTP pyrophosphatase (non-canonical NTP hydrolase)
MTVAVYCPRCKKYVEATEVSRSRYVITYRCTECGSTILVARWQMDELIQSLRSFNSERGWSSLSPQDLVMALSVEVAELVECFQWLTAEESMSPGPTTRVNIEEEVGDVLIYLVDLTDVLAIDLVRAAKEKLEKNSRKYPVALLEEVK